MDYSVSDFRKYASIIANIYLYNKSQDEIPKSLIEKICFKFANDLLTDKQFLIPTNTINLDLLEVSLIICKMAENYEYDFDDNVFQSFAEILRTKLDI